MTLLPSAAAAAARKRGPAWLTDPLVYRPGAVAAVLQDVVGAAEVAQVELGLDHYAAPLFGVEAFRARLICKRTAL